MSTRPPSRPNRICRRTVLRGVGASLGLPWLESMPVWGTEPVVDDSPQIPLRFGVQFMACGVNADHWWAKGAGEEMELGKSLQPLAPLKSKLNFISGLFNESAVGVGIHPGQTGNILSGAALQKGAELRGGISIDQVLANSIGQATVQPSLVLGCEQPTTGYHETNFSMAYSSHISWQNATSPVPMEVYPALAFDSLLDNRGSRRNQSVLDRVKEHAESLSRRVSAGDKVKIEEYLSSVREVEKRIERVRARQDKAADRAKAGNVSKRMSRPDSGLPEDIREHMKLMCDIIALAFQTDKTRVATLLMCRDISGLFYPFLDVRSAHHSASHKDLTDDFERVTRYYVSQYAYLASRLDQMKEGEQSVLDHSCLLFINNMWSGSKHDSTKIPLLQLGGLGDTVQTGRVMDYTDRPDDQRKLCSYYLTLAQRMGLSLDAFGDATRPLAGV
ncbi:DUF1552 domain-containing protein [Stieleria sp. TO1_6]|uniref:DUF1552 domain-containing protein n=1 Tax=Stieleria tagensis TaxID=2956795 RepID=UPI00209B3D66|nr:DUF1552 domain-containing protein [Stieleria tagensis]MCO8121795.1 DUF1552 domain-containing protein [Stieleria tagensis]